MTRASGGARAAATLVAVLLAIGVVAGGAVRLGDAQRGAAIVVDHSEGVSHRSWTVPNAVDVTVVGNDVWLLVKDNDATYSLGRFDEATGQLHDQRTVLGHSLSMTSAGTDIWLWGEGTPTAAHAAADTGSRDLPPAGRQGVVHRVSTSPRGDVRVWDLGAQVPIMLVADADRAWSYSVDAATFEVPALVHLGGRRDGDADPLGTRADAYSLALDGDRLLVDEISTLLVLDRDTGDVIDRRPPVRLEGRTDDGRVWADVGTTSPYRVRAIGDTSVLEATGHVATVAGGIAVGARWFNDPNDPEVDAVLDQLRDVSSFQGPEPLGDVAYYLETPQSVGAPPARLHRWAPRRDHQQPPTPRADAPKQVERSGCEPLAAGYLTDDAGDWAESAITDDHLAGAVRRRGPQGAYVVAVAGPAAWINSVPGAQQRPPEGIRSLYLVRTPNGVAAQVTPAGSPRDPPCDAVTLLGYGLSPEELRAQTSIVLALQYDDRSPP